MAWLRTSIKFDFLTFASLFIFTVDFADDPETASTPGNLSPIVDESMDAIKRA